MQLRFLGTGTSMGVPVVGCSCAVCTSADPRNRRSRTSALLRSGERHILIDAGPDFRTQALSAGITRLDAVLLTHSHFDHVAGLDDLRPLTFSGGTMPIYGSPATLGDVRARFAYAFDESSKGSTRPSIDLRPVAGEFVLDDGTPVRALEILHGTWTITGYRIGGLGYITDASSIPAVAWGALAGLDVLVLNALRYEPHPTHFSIDEAVSVVERLRPRRAFFVHMTHGVDHAEAERRLPAHIRLAYDGLEISVE